MPLLGGIHLGGFIFTGELPTFKFFFGRNLSSVIKPLANPIIITRLWKIDSRIALRLAYHKIMSMLGLNPSSWLAVLSLCSSGRRRTEDSGHSSFRRTNGNFSVSTNSRHAVTTDTGEILYPGHARACAPRLNPLARSIQSCSGRHHDSTHAQVVASPQYIDAPISPHSPTA